MGKGLASERIGSQPDYTPEPSRRRQPDLCRPTKKETTRRGCGPRKRPRGLNKEGRYSRCSAAIPKEQQTRTHGRVLTIRMEEGQMVKKRRRSRIPAHAAGDEVKRQKQPRQQNPTAANALAISNLLRNFELARPENAFKIDPVARRPWVDVMSPRERRERNADKMARSR